MPALINTCANILFGAALALVARQSPAMRREVVSWPLLLLLAFEALAVTPIATYHFRFYPQWSMLYWFDPQIFTDLYRWVGWLSALAILLNFGAAIGGFFLARLGIVAERKWLAWSPVAFAGAAILWVVWTFGDRIVFIGDYDAFWQGQARLIFAGLAGWIGVLMYLGAFLFVVWIHTRYAQKDPSIFS